MKKYTLPLLIVISFCCTANSQSWHLLANSPSAGFRHDDLYFINADTGWVVNVDGKIYKTIDGGNSFIMQLSQPATSFRCVGFADANIGWAGNLGPGAWNPTTDTLPLYQTIDGGNTWQAVTNISGPLPTGICGISVVNDSVVYAVGRVGGPCHIMKTVNGGASWTSANFNPPAYYLVDCKFFSADTGIVAGCTGPGGFSSEKIAVWLTNDGGLNWQMVYNDSGSYNGHCWKLTFPSRNIGYASIESSCLCDTTPVLKTTDGGLTWEKKIWDTAFTATSFYEQGIGFINDSLGWCGSASMQVKQTTDGGETWNVFPFVPNFNRFRKVNDSIAYASGNRIWKYSNQPTGMMQATAPAGLTLEQNYPNPFKDRTTIKYSIPSHGKVILKIYDFAGRPVKTLVNKEQNKGTYSSDISLPYYFDTHFFCTLYFNDYLITRELLMVKKE